MKKKIIFWFNAILYFFRLKKVRKPLPGSTIITVAGPATAEVKEKVTETILNDEQSVQKFLCEYVIPDGKAEELVKYITDQRKKYPGMKNDRLLRKAAEYFHLTKISFMQ